MSLFDPSMLTLNILDDDESLYTELFAPLVETVLGDGNTKRRSGGTERARALLRGRKKGGETELL